MSPADAPDPLGPLAGSRSVEQAVAVALRRAILDGSLTPGHRLTVRQLATRFGVSVTPVRIALKELASEGLVELRPQTGAWVTPLSSEELEEILLTRLGIEPWLARLGAPRLGDRERAALDRHLAAVADAARVADRDAYLVSSWALRRVCYAAAQRPRLLARLDGLYELSRRYHLVNLAETERLERSTTFMTEFHAACRAADGARAEAVMRDALSWTLRYLTPG